MKRIFGTAGRWLRREVPPFGELLGLATLAVARPVLDVFTDAADVFVLRRARGVDVVLFALAVTLLPALVLWLLEVAVGFVNQRARFWFHVAAIAFLAGIFTVVAMKQTIDSNEFWGHNKRFVAGLAGAAAVAAAYVGLRFVRLWLRYLAAAAAAFVVLFLFASPVTAIVFPGDAPEEVAVRPTDPAPVIMVVFDELPTQSLLDGRGQVDEELFPAFGELARSGSWYRNHTTVAPLTAWALPAVVTGRYPDREALPIAAEYPQSLFTLLSSTYDVDASEVLRLCPARVCADDDPASTPEVLGALADTVTDVWGGLASPWAKPEQLAFSIGDPPVDREPRERAERFASSLTTAERPTFDFLHVLLPHQPWRFLESGRTYDAPDPPPGLSADQLTWVDPSMADVTRRRHLLQLQMTDRLLGRMLDRLRDLGTYDESLVVVTADHGISFSAGERIRGVTDENPNEILWTPLFVKAPGQRRGEVVDAPMRAVDIVPTIADILGLDIPWEIDGVAASDPRPASYDRPRILDWRYSQAEPDDGDYFTVEGDESYAEVLEARPSSVGGDPDARLYRRGRYGRIVGRRVDDLDVGSEAPFGGELNPPGPEPVVEADATSLPVYLVGKLPGGPEVEVAVAVNGVVGTVTDVTYPFGPSARIFTTVVPEHLLREGRNEIELYLLEGGSVPTLHPIPTVEAES